MKINDVLECLNKVLDSERGEDSKVQGHLIAMTEIKKSMGPYKHAYTHIYYIDLNNKEKYEYCTGDVMDRCTIDKEDKLKEKSEKAALTKLFRRITSPKLWDELLTGNV